MADWKRVCALADIPDGEPLGTDLQTARGAEPIALVKHEGRCYAVHDICTHAYAKLSTGFQEGKLLFCPLHAASFDVTNGEHVDPPAEESVRSYAVKIENGEVWVDAGE